MAEVVEVPLKECTDLMPKHLFGPKYKSYEGKEGCGVVKKLSMITCTKYHVGGHTVSAGVNLLVGSVLRLT